MRMDEFMASLQSKLDNLQPNYSDTIEFGERYYRRVTSHGLKDWLMLLRIETNLCRGLISALPAL